MSYSINTYHLPTLRNYEAALKHYEKITPIRGRSDDCRPLGDRKKTHQRICKLFNGDISCRLYITDCVIYHTDGSMTIDFGGWLTASTAKFIHALHPDIGATANGNTGYVWVRHHGNYRTPEGGLKICPKGTPMNPEQEYKTLLDKKKAAEARKKIKPFLSWVQAVEKLGGEIRSNTSFLDVKEILRCDDPELYPEVANTYYDTWRHEINEYQMLRDLYTYEGCFVEVPVPLGKMKTRTQWEGCRNAA